MTCPTTFHLCPSSAEHAGFSVLDRKTGKETPASSEADARQIAERDYPGCVFAMSTISSIHPSVTPGSAMDCVVMAVCQTIEGVRLAVKAYVVSSVMTNACIPFSLGRWGSVKDGLPRDQRFPVGRS